MSADIHTRFLVVTLPDVSGEEADTLAEALTMWVTGSTYGPPWFTGATVKHALGEAVLAGSLRRPYARAGLSLRSVANLRQVSLTANLLMSPEQAREVAGALLILAEEIDPTTTTEGA